MQCYTELIPPAGVTQALALPFTASDASNLIIAKTCLLQIFSQKQVNHGQDTKLVLVAEYQLPGTVTALGRVKVLNSLSGGDAVLIAFRDAKLSLIEWDGTQHCISTVSIHYYESENVQRSPWASEPRHCITHLTVDPSSRCAAFHFGIGSLAIIPFHQLGDDLVMDDFDDTEGSHSPTKQTNGGAVSHSTPYATSFVLSLTTLDPGILHPIDVAFLHDYREPTFGILYSTAARSSNMSFERRDVTIYAVFALDFDQKASTTLLLVPRLPDDLYKVVPLPQPVGGTLLVGGNEFIHVDQGGKTTAIGVNEFARQATSFSMSDQSDQELRLEGCQIAPLAGANGDMLVILASGDMAILTFVLDGRSVSSLSVRRVASEGLPQLFSGQASCMAALGLGRMFIGSEDADSVLIGTSRNVASLRKHSSKTAQHANGFDDGDESEAEEVDDEDDDDDLYGDAVTQVPSHAGNGSSAVGSDFRLLDILTGAPFLRDVTVGRRPKRKRDSDDGEITAGAEDFELAAACGRGRAGGVAFITKDLKPESLRIQESHGLDGLWSFRSKKSKAKQDPMSDADAVDEHVIVSKVSSDENGESILYTVSDGELEIKEGTDFDPSSGRTIEVGHIANGTLTAQVLEKEIKVWDASFGLEQIVGEEDGLDAKVVSASFADPFVLVVKETSTMLLLQADRVGELSPLSLPASIADKKAVSATLYKDEADFFNTKRFHGKSAKGDSASCLLVVLTADGLFSILSLHDLAVQVFSYSGLPFLPTLLAKDSAIPRHWKNKDTLTEVLMADLGDSYHKVPHLIVRNSIDDIAIYEPYGVPGSLGTFQFRKLPTRHMARVPEEAAEMADDAGTRNSASPMRTLPNVGGYATVFVPGASPVFVLKSASSAPRIHSLHSSEAVKALSSYHDSTCQHGFMYIDSQSDIFTSELPANTDFVQSEWPVQKVELGQDVSAISFFEPTNSYVVVANQAVGFQLPQSDESQQDRRDEDTEFLPRLEESTLCLLSSSTHKLISSYPFEPLERAMCMEVMNLEISEETHERRPLIVIGTAIIKGENISTRGHIYIFDVVDVVPIPNVAESDLTIKLIAKEEVKGAVTSISAVGTQGFLLAAQGQKCMVRGLKEDHSILPVAFMDMRYYVNVAKELAGTGLCILGDAMSGLWLMGYCEEPYKMQLLGRDLTNMAVLAAEFLPDNKQLFIVASDGDGVLHVLQFDPENPKTERGMKLLRRSTFNTGQFPTSMTLLPQLSVLPPQQSSGRDNDDDDDEDNNDDVAGAVASSSMEVDTTAPADSPSSPSSSAAASSSGGQSMLITTQSGALALLTPLSDSAYRRLSSLQNILTANVEHACGLNPRAYRAVETDGVGGRAVLDGNLVLRWLDQSAQHRAGTADRIGATWDELRADLELISGVGGGRGAGAGAGVGGGMGG